MHNLCRLTKPEQQKIEQHKQDLYQQWREKKLIAAVQWLNSHGNVARALQSLTRKYGPTFAKDARNAWKNGRQ